MKQLWNNFWKRKYNSASTKDSWSKKRISKVLDKYVKIAINVLDAGCGSGYFSRYFVRKGCFVYACDYSDDAINLAIQTTENKCVAYLKRDLLDSEAWKEYIKFFDIIFTDGLFEHFSPAQQEKLIQNLIKLKKDNGLIITFVPNRLSLWTLIRPLFMPSIYEKPFMMDYLKNLHSQMEIIEFGGLNTLPIKHSPDTILGNKFGMLLYVIAK